MAFPSGKRQRSIIAVGLIWPAALALYAGVDPVVLCHATGDHTAVERGQDGCALVATLGANASAIADGSTVDPSLDPSAPAAAVAPCCERSGSVVPGRECRDSLIALFAAVHGRSARAHEVSCAASTIAVASAVLPDEMADVPSALALIRFFPPRSPVLRV